MKKNLTAIAAIAFAALGLGGCAAEYGYGYQQPGCCGNPMFGTGVPQSSAQAYVTSQAQQTQMVLLGTILAIHKAVIAPASTTTGEVGGALAGGLAGGLLSHNPLIGLAGAVAGAGIGSVAQTAASKQAGQVVTVQLTGGQVLAITQAADPRLRVGQRVQVLQGGGVSRVMPL